MSDASDHFGTLTKISNVGKYVTKTDVFCRKSKLSPQVWQQFNSELSSLLSSTHDNERDANVFANNIIKAYSKVIDKFMPLQKLSRK